MEKIRMAIIGAGTWGETHASIFREHPLAEPVAICDKNVERAQAVAQKYGIPAVFEDYREMIAQAQFDAASIVTPDYLHADMTIAMAEAGKHVLIEKPLATTREDVFRMVDAIEKSGIRAMVDLHNRWNPPFNTAKKRVESGALGAPYSAYFRHNDIKWVATDLLPWAASSSILWFLGSHSLDTLRWLFDDEVESVYSVSRSGLLQSMGVDTTDMYLTTIRFKNGGIAQMENGWITPNGNGNVNDMQCTLLCEKGKIDINTSNHNMIHITTEEAVQIPDVLVSNFVFDRCKGFAYESIRNFVDALVTGEAFPVSVADAANTSLAILAIMESAKTGLPVKVRLEP